MKGRDDLSKSGWYVISWKMSGQHETIRQHSRNEVAEFLCKKRMEHIERSVPTKQKPFVTRSKVMAKRVRFPFPENAE